MLFSALGQGYVFLLILCLGLSIGAIEVLCLWIFRKAHRWLKSHQNRPLSTANSTQYLDTNTPRKITFLLPQKNITKNDKKISKNTKKYLKNSIQFCIGLFRICFYVLTIYLLILLCDYGEIRAYHFVAFLIGFCLIKAIFAKLNKNIIQSANIQT